MVLVDESLAVPEKLSGRRVLCLPILRTAKETVGRVQTANVLAVGCVNALLGITDMDTLKKAVLLHVPKGTEEINLRALDEGVRLVSAVPGEQSAPAVRPEKKKGASK